MSDYPVLKTGSVGPEVTLLQSILQSQGFFNGTTAGHFQSLTLRAVVHFQQTHLGPTGVFLDVDGVVGPDTWWALFNPSGDSQHNNYQQSNPMVENKMRAAVVAWAEKEHARRVREVPDGSNWSPRIREYLAAAGLDFPAPWCQSFTCCGAMETLNIYPPGCTGLVAAAYAGARKTGMGFPRSGKYSPVPGDQFIQLHGDGTGHTGFIYRVSADGGRVNTIEGNSGNRVKLGLRDVTSFVGYINIFRDAERPPAFIRGLIAGDGQDNSDR